MRKHVFSAGLVCVAVAGACSATEPLAQGGEISRGGTGNAAMGGAGARASATASGASGDMQGAEMGGRASAAGGAGAGAVGCAGEAGTAGAETGGSAGHAGDAGGAGRDSEPLEFQPECAEPTFVWMPSTCGEALTREALACGRAGSQFDGDCCHRPECEEDADCGSGARCLSRLVQSQAFQGSQVETCEMDGGRCDCWVSSNIDSSSDCVVEDARIEEFDCDVRGRSCATLGDWAWNLRWGLEEAPPRSHEQLELCLVKVEAARSANCAE